MQPIIFNVIISVLALLSIKCSTYLNHIAAQQQAIISSCDRIRFVSRNSWSARANQSPMQPFVSVPYRVFIHQAWDGQTCQDIDSCIIRVRSIQANNMFNKGWPDISYNFLIAGNGAVFEGLGWEVRGFHTLNYNEESIGVAFIGTFQDVFPNARMEQALRDLIDCGVQRRLLDPNYLLHGHRDARCTICPGSALYSRLATSYARFQPGPLQKYSCPVSGTLDQLPPGITGITGGAIPTVQQQRIPVANGATPNNIVNQMVFKDDNDRLVASQGSSNRPQPFSVGTNDSSRQTSTDQPRDIISFRPYKLESSAPQRPTNDPTRLVIDATSPQNITVSIVNITAFGKRLVR